MDNLPDKSNWKTEYSVALVLGITYIILLGVFTLLFNHAL